MTMRTLLALFLILTGFAAHAPAALAHAGLVASEPADGAVVQTAPHRIVLRFNEPVTPLVLRLIDPAGGVADVEAVAAEHHSIAITPPAGLANGTHAVSWRVVSADGHPISGSFSFSIGALSANQGTAVLQSGGAVQAVLWSARLTLYLGVFVGIGGAFFAAWIARRKRLWPLAHRAIVAALWAGIAASALSVGLQGLDALALPMGAIHLPSVWLQGLETSFGVTAALAVLALVAGLMSLAAPSTRHAKLCSAVALAGIGCAFAASGHASTADPQWLTRTGVFIHVTGLAFWLGSLLPLFVMLWERDAEGAAIMNRFSAAILPVVLVLMLVGATLAAIQVGSIGALWGTRYGTILLLKLVGVGGVLCLATLNRIVFTPALSRKQPARERQFAGSIALESLLVVAVLALVTGWRFTPPPRALAAAASVQTVAAATPVSVHIHTERAAGELVLETGRIGRTAARITLTSASGAPLRPQEVVLAFSNASSGIEPFERHAVRSQEGIWCVDNLVLPVPGQWTVRVDALVSDFDKIMLEGLTELRG